MSFELILPFLRPIEPLLLDESVSEIMGNPDGSWWSEREGVMQREAGVKMDANSLRVGLEVIANKMEKRLDADSPLLHVQLPDGSRLAAVMPPVAKPSPAVTIRKFTSRRFTVEDLIARGSLTRPLADFLGGSDCRGQDSTHQRWNGHRKDHAPAHPGGCDTGASAHRCHRGHRRACLSRSQTSLRSNARQTRSSQQ